MAEERTGIRRGAFTFTRPRIIQCAVVIVLAVLGAALPYITLAYDNFASEPIRPTHAMWPGTEMLRRLSLTYLTATPDAPSDQLQRGLDVTTLGATLQQVAVVVAIITVVGLCMDEINKFLWWPLHLSGWMFVIGAVVLFVGTGIWHGLGVDVVLGPGWVPLAIDGVLILVLTFGARKRIDSYRGL